jgi:adenine-specific DNA methylase
VVEGPSQRLLVPTATFDAVITDPPYADDVHYSELSDLFRAWAGLPTGTLTGDAIVRRLHGPNGTDAYQQLLTDVFQELHRALRPGGHLILSYANREPSAWVALFSALQDAGFRVVGYQVVPSENELDHAKAGKRACTLDVLLDLVHADTPNVMRWRPSEELDGDEGAYCKVIGERCLDIGTLTSGWAAAFIEDLRATEFLR